MDARRVVRSRENRIIAGVASGLAAFFGVDPVFLRIGFVVLSLFNGVGLILYLTLWLIMPNEDSSSTGREMVQEAITEMRTMLEEVVARLRGVLQRP